MRIHCIRAQTKYVLENAVFGKSPRKANSPFARNGRRKSGGTEGLKHTALLTKLLPTKLHPRIVGCFHQPQSHISPRTRTRIAPPHDHSWTDFLDDEDSAGGKHFSARKCRGVKSNTVLGKRRFSGLWVGQVVGLQSQSGTPITSSPLFIKDALNAATRAARDLMREMKKGRPRRKTE